MYAMLARTPSLYRLIVALKPPTRITRQIDHFAETLAPDAHRILPAHQHITLGITDDWPDFPMRW
jgi:2'-5' RNA ligase